MEKLKERHSPDVHVRALGVAQVNLSGRPDTEALAAEAEAERARLKAARDAYEESVMRRMAATAVVNYADSNIDGVVRRLARKALDLVDGDRDAASYKQLFTETPSSAMQDRATPEQATFVAHLINTLRSGGEYQPLEPFIDLLVVAQAEVDVALNKRHTRYVEEMTAKSVLERTCDEARSLYNGFHARLSILFPDDEALVESFFAEL